MVSPTNKAELIKFVKLYETHRVLWDYNDASFYDKELRASAFRDMSIKFNIPVKEVKRKITNIRGVLRKEKFKLRQITRPGRKPYMSKWYLFKHLTFLLDIKNDRPKLKQQKNKVEPDMIKTEVTEEEEQGTDMQPEDSHEEQNNTENESGVEDSIAWVDMNDVIQDASATELTQNSNRPSIVRVHDDVYDNFGRLIASELRKYDRRTLAYVKKAILDVIFKADTDNLDLDNDK